jgi:hypothetical protein
MKEMKKIAFLHAHSIQIVRFVGVELVVWLRLESSSLKALSSIHSNTASRNFTQPTSPSSANDFFLSVNVNQQFSWLNVKRGF